MLLNVDGGYRRRPAIKSGPHQFFLGVKNILLDMLQANKVTLTWVMGEV
jgi:hypothetical protein